MSPKRSMQAALAGGCVMAVLLLLLAPAAHAVVSRLSIPEIRADVANEGDSVTCMDGKCITSCVSTTSGQDWDLDGACVPSLRPTCNGEMCVMEVDLTADLTVAGNVTLARMAISANPIHHVRLISGPTYTTTAPFRATWTYQIATAVAVGMFSDNENTREPYHPLVHFTAIQGFRNMGISIAVKMDCQALETGSTITFNTPEVDCLDLGTVTATATTTGCPNIFEPYNQGLLLGLFSGSLEEPTTTEQPTFATQYPGNNNIGGPSTFLATIGAGQVEVTFRRSWYDPADTALPAGVTSMKIGHRTWPYDSTWSLSTDSVAYEDNDNDGFGAACDCNDNDASVYTGCAARRLLM